MVIFDFKIKHDNDHGLHDVNEELFFYANLQHSKKL